MDSRKLIIKPRSAQLLKNPEKCDHLMPYVKVIIGDQVQSTSPATDSVDGYMNPIWDNVELTFNVSGDEIVCFEVWDFEKVLSNYVIAKGTLSLSDFFTKESGKFWHQDVKLMYGDQDAGILDIRMEFLPGDLSKEFSQLSVADTESLAERTTDLDTPSLINQESGLSLPENRELVSTEGLLTQPVTTTETKVITHEPIITKGQPLVYERTIVHEKPIITERTIVHSEQPIIVEKPELRERVLHEQIVPSVITENPIYRQEEGMLGEQLEGTPEVHTTMEHIRENAEIHRETPIVYEKDVILEKPIIHEKDIIYREKPIIVEKPEIVEKHIYDTQTPVTQIHDTLFKRNEEFTTEKLGLDDAITEKEAPRIDRAEPQFVQELPDVHETEIIHERPVILEKPIVHTEKEVIHEKPELHEREIFHRDETIHRRDPVINTAEGTDMLPAP